MRRRLWVPSLLSCWCALKLALPSYLGGGILFLFESWRCFIVACIFFLSTSHAAATFFLTFSFFWLIAGLIWYLLLTGLYSFVLKIFWSDPPRWLQPPNHSVSVIFNFVIALLATLPVVGVFALEVFIKQVLEELTQQDIRSLVLSDFLPKTFVIWFIAAVYLVHWLKVSNAKRPSSSGLPG